MYIREFFFAANSDAWEVVQDLEEVFIVQLSTSLVQRCQVDAFPVVVSYKPARVDFGALRQGRLSEMLNVVPEWKAKVWLKDVRLRGVEGFDALGSLAGTQWLEDVLTSQMHKFVVSLPGLRSVCRVGSAARGFGTLPQSATRKDFNRQLQRAVLALLRSIASEGARAGAAVAGATSSSR